MSSESNPRPAPDTVPLGQRGPSYASRRLQIAGQRASWQPVWRVWAFGALFAVPAALVLGVLLAAGEVQLNDPYSWILPLLALMFMALGALVVRVHYRPIVFDRQLGWFWRGRPQAEGSADLAQLQESVRITDIHALQLIGGYKNHGPYASWWVWELNLVLVSGQRLPVIAHANQRLLREDAATLASWLNVPLLD